MQQKGKTSWDYKQAKPFSFIFGADVRPTERLLGFAGYMLVPIFIYYLILIKKITWTPEQALIIILCSIDISGGFVAQSLNSCKRFFHSERDDDDFFTKMMKNKSFFASLHIHPIIIEFITDWAWGLTWYIILIVCAHLILQAPLYLKRPIAMLMIGIAILMNLYIFPVPFGLEWLIPMLFIKVLYGNLVPEEPYVFVEKEEEDYYFPTRFRRERKNRGRK